MADDYSGLSQLFSGQLADPELARQQAELLAGVQQMRSVSDTSQWANQGWGGALARMVAAGRSVPMAQDAAAAIASARQGALGDLAKIYASADPYKTVAEGTAMNPLARAIALSEPLSTALKSRTEAALLPQARATGEAASQPSLLSSPGHAGAASPGAAAAADPLASPPAEDADRAAKMRWYNSLPKAARIAWRRRIQGNLGGAGSSAGPAGSAAAGAGGAAAAAPVMPGVGG